MEINNLLKDVISINDYITVTQDVMNKFTNLKVSINIATVLTLKKIRSLEIEYLNKCDENGVACIVFDRLLATPPSKVWGVLAKELIYLLQYWLEAIRKHLIDHSTLWWMFLKVILKFIKEIRLKDPSIPNMLVELTAESLFDLATAPRPDVFQRHEILHSLNMVCAESGREIRFAMRSKFGDYFVKIAAQMATSGYLPCQYSSLECLLRWLVPRQERSLRVSAAEKWLPRDLCPQTARNIFLNSNWMNFFQDARDFLNALNAGNGLVTSVICRRLCIGEIVIINGTERQQSWLDFNTSGKSVSVLLDPRVLEVFGVADHRACETFIIDKEITETAVLQRESLGLTISLNTLRAPYIRPTDISTGDGRQVTVVVSSRTDLRTLDGAMTTTFGDKYQLLLDLDTDVSQSPQRSYNRNKNELNSEEDTRFSHPVEIKRRKHSGYIVRSKVSGGLSSPSTVSTSSLIQLKDRLAALPRFNFDKEPVSVCAQPALSNVTERTEHDDRSIYTTSTIKFQPYGVCHKSFRNPGNQKISSEQKSRSDGEAVKQKSRGGRRLLSPVVSDDNSTSLLLVATVGSTNDTVINDTIERLSKSKDFQDDNIVDLLVQEALQAKPKSREVSDSGINTDEKKSQEESEAIDDTPNEVKHSRSRPLKKHCTIVSKSTTDDESNTEAINETPAFVNPRKKIYSNEPNKTVNDPVKETFHAKTIEDFFSQHIAENKRGEIVISPSLAKKINETSSETSENFDENYLLINEEVNTDIEQAIFNDIAIIDCLNDMVDKVCSEFVKCTEYFYNDNATAVTTQTDKDEETEHFKDKYLKTPKQTKPEIQRPKRNIKLKYKPVKKAKVRAVKKTKNTEQESPKKMSTIIEQKEEDTFVEEINSKTDSQNEEVLKSIETPRAQVIETPVVRRKRKLYSPKDENIEEEIHNVEKSDDVSLSEIKTRNITITTATCYKEIEKDRKKYTRLPRSRKSKFKVAEMLSPRTVKNNSMFDNLKQTVESNEKITLVDKNTDVFNFTSDSDEDDFKKKLEINKRTSATTIGNFKATTVKRKRNTRRAKESESSYKEENKTKPLKRKKVTKRTNKKIQDVKDPVVDLVGARIDLVDEKMREAVTEGLNTSIVEHTVNLEPEKIEPVLREIPQMEEICESATNDIMVYKKNAKKSPLERVYDSECTNELASKKKVQIEIGSLHDSVSNDTTASKRTYKRAKTTDVEEVHDEKSSDTLVSKKKATKRVNKTTELLKIKKEKGLTKKDKKVPVTDKDDDGTISPLPGLVVESMPKQKEDINDSLTTNMLQKFKRIYQDGPEAVNDSVNTQNMLSDVDKFNNSAQNWMSVVDETFFTDKNTENTAAKTERDKKNSKQIKQVKPKPKYNTRQKIIDNPDNQNLDIVHIHDVNDNQPDKSISTDGITAHGDSEEEPPNPETIVEELHPRELHDLDQSMRDYFTKLTREIHNSTKDRESNKSVEDEEVCTILCNEVDKTKSAISPIISVKRLSFEDISRWMPSRRTSDTDSPLTSPKVNIQTKQTIEHYSNTRNQTKPNINSVENTPKSTVQTKTMKCQETSTPESINLKSSVVPIARISLEEFDKWLPMPKSFEGMENVTLLQKTGYGTRSKSILKNLTDTEAILCKTKDKSEAKKTGKKIAKQKIVENDTYSDINSTRQLKNKSIDMRKDEVHKLKDVSNSDSDDGKKAKDVLAKKTTRTRNTTLEEREIFDLNKISNVKDAKNHETQRTKSVIDSTESLIENKSIEKGKPTISPIKLVDKLAPNIGNTSSDDDECLKKIRCMFSNTRANRHSLRNTTSKSKSTSNEVSPIKRTPQKRKFTSITSERKKRSLDPLEAEPNIFKEPKSRFYESKKVDAKDVIISGSGPSLSSVSDWFRKAEPMANRGNDASMSYKATIENVMEKLDTTLVEINENTSKKFVNLIMDVQKNLNEQKEERLKLYKQVAKELISDIIRIMDEKFTDLDTKSQDMGNDFMEKLKKQAFDVIRNDCKQKRAMVILLKEDVQAVIDHIERYRSADSP